MLSHSRDLVQQEIQRLLGKDVAFDRLEASVWGGLGFSAKEFRITDDRRFAATPFVHANELRLGISLWQLLHGRLVIDSLSLNTPEVQIITNEEGAVNVSAFARRKKALSLFPRIPAANNRRPGVEFAIDAIHVTSGRFDLIDRAVTGAAELQVRNVELHVSGLNRSGPTRIKLAAALTEGLAHDVVIQGTLGAPTQSDDWFQRPLDFEIDFDSLHIPLLAAAFPRLQERIPRGLEVTGPMTLHARLSGTARQPAFSEVTLQVPLFGSSDYNAILRGSIEFPGNRNATGAQLQGTLRLQSIGLEQLRNLPGLKDIFPAPLSLSGPMNFISRFEGTWDNLRIGARFDADAGEMKLGEWLRKPSGNSGQWTGQLTRQHGRLLIHNSSLRLGNLAIAVSGMLETAPNFRAKLKVQNPKSDAAVLAELIPLLATYDVSGSTAWDLTVDKSFNAADRPWSVRGNLKLSEARLHPQQNGNSIEHLNATLVFLGNQARIENASLRYGPSEFNLTATLTELGELRGVYEARAAALSHLPNVPLLSNPANVIRNLVAKGEFQAQAPVPTLSAAIRSPDGMLENISYQDLRADIEWSPARTQIKQLSLRTLNGTIQSEASWTANDARSYSFVWSPHVEAIELSGLLKQKFPLLKNRFGGALELRGQFSGSSIPDSNSIHALSGTGVAQISNGMIKDFNLLAQIFGRSNGNSAPSRLPAALASLVNRADTPFDVFKGTFKLDPQRLSTDNLLLSTPDYTITGAGWVAMDRSTRWNGLLVLSPAITQELQKEYKMLRFFIDRRGRLSIAFNVDGTPPNVRIRPENRALAQALRWGSASRGGDAAGGESKQPKEWLPKSLDDFLKR